MATVKDLKEHLENYYNDDDVIAYDLWGTDDVAYHMEGMFELIEPLDELEKESVIENLDANKDCNYGITWNTLDIHIDNVLRNRED